MQIGLHGGKSLISALIRWQTRSPYSHASITGEDGRVIEAREGRGVISSARLVPAKGETVELFRVDGLTAAQRQTIWDFAVDQIGKRYDYTMVARFLSRRQESRKSRGRWFCSELVFAAFAQGGVNLLERTQPWEVSPGMLARSPLLRFEDALLG